MTTFLYSSDKKYTAEEAKAMEKIMKSGYRESHADAILKTELKSMRQVENYLQKNRKANAKPPEPIPKNTGKPYSEWLREKENKQKLNRAKICLQMRLDRSQVRKKKHDLFFYKSSIIFFIFSFSETKHIFVCEKQ